MSSALQQQIQALQQIQNSQRDSYDREAIQTLKSLDPKNTDLIVTTVDGSSSSRTTVAKTQSKCIGVSEHGLNYND